MAFLFKSKKSQDRALSSRDGNSSSHVTSASVRLARDEKNVAQRATPTGSLNSMDELGNGSPDQIRRGGSLDQMQSSDLPVSRLGQAEDAPSLVMQPYMLSDSYLILVASQRATFIKPKCFTLPLVATAANVHAIQPHSVPKIWRCRQRNRFERG